MEFLAKKIQLKIRVLLILTLQGLFVSNSYGYNNDAGIISLELQNTPIEKVFSAIEKQSDYNFFYESNIIDVNRKVSISVKQKSISAVLDRIFNNKKSVYKIVNNHIILKALKVKGKLVDKITGKAIPYCNIFQEDSFKGTYSNENGEFEMTIDPFTPSLSISHLNYEKELINIDDSEELIVRLSPTLNILDEIVINEESIANRNTIKSLDKVLEYYNYYNPVEKVYVQTDKTKIEAGEELWYSAFTVIGPNHYYSTASKYLHIDIVDNKNQIVVSQKIKIDNGKSKGHFKIPENIITGNYQLRAYTDWMKNFDLDFVFKKPLTISNEKFVEYISEPSKKNEIDLQFFPEGGNAVDGIKGRIAFKAIGTDGLPRNVEGKIVDSKGNEIRQLKSNNLGVGYFNLKPSFGEKYSVILENGSKFKLPEISAQGYSMFVDNLNTENISVKIQSTPDLKNKDFYLIAHTRNKKHIQGKYQFKDNNSVIDIQIPKNILPTGIVTFTLLDEKMRPWSERIAFVNNKDGLVINTKVKNNAIGKEGLVSMDISVTDKDGNPAPTNFSMAVTNPDTNLKKKHGSNLLTYLMLESDLKGYVKNPGQYFENNSQLTNYNLDLVMLTNGWRRFNWKKLKNNKFDKSKKYTFSQGYSVSGVVRRVSNGELFKKKTIHLIVESEEKKRVYITRTNIDGSFEFENIDHTGATKLTFKGFNHRQIGIHVTLDDKTSLNLSKDWVGNLYNDTEDVIYKDEYITTSNYRPRPIPKGKSTLIGEVVINSKVEKITEKKRPAKRIPTPYGVQPDDTVYGDELTNPNTFLYDLAKVPGVSLLGNNILIRGGTPSWFLDGQPIGNFGSDTMNGGSNGSGSIGVGIPFEIANLEMQNIERIEVIKTAVNVGSFGFRAPSGAILVYTKRGSDHFRTKEPSFDGIGFSETKEFYVPKYQADLSKVNAIDYKKTLFWGPSIQTDKNGKATIQFYNVNGIDEVQVAIDALTTNGIPGTYLKVIK